MDRLVEQWFYDYMGEFEQKVIVRGISIGALGRNQLVPVRNGRLSRIFFGRVVGVLVRSDEVFAIDYYGHLKQSIGFRERVRVERKLLIGKQIKKVEAMVVHFGSLRIEEVAEIGNDSVVNANFARFKKELLVYRNFPKTR